MLGDVDSLGDKEREAERLRDEVPDELSVASGDTVVVWLCDAEAPGVSIDECEGDNVDVWLPDVVTDRLGDTLVVADELAEPDLVEESETEMLALELSVATCEVLRDDVHVTDGLLDADAVGIELAVRVCDRVNTAGRLTLGVNDMLCVVDTEGDDDDD